jgi:uncharacterized protein YjbJ (UPF0337 family)
MENIDPSGKTWEDIKDKLKETHVEITDGDLTLIPGREDDFLERLARKLNKSKSEVRELIESIAYSKNIAG